MRSLLAALSLLLFLGKTTAQSGTGPLGTTYRFFEKTETPVLVFVPKNLAFSAKTDMVVHFHDPAVTLDEAERANRLVQQFAEAKRPAILVVPQNSSALTARLGGANGFKNFMAELLDSLGARAGRVTQPGVVVLSCHAGGYANMAKAMAIGGLDPEIKEAWLFDGLMGEFPNFELFIRTPGRRFINLWASGGETKQATGEFDKIMKERGPTFYAVLKESELQKKWPWMPAGRVFMISVELGRAEIMHQSNLFYRMVSATPFFK